MIIYIFMSHRFIAINTPTMSIINMSTIFLGMVKSLIHTPIGISQSPIRITIILIFIIGTDTNKLSLSHRHRTHWCMFSPEIS